MNTNRISVDVEINDHRLLKSYCGSEGITIKDFVIDAIFQQLEKKLNKNERNYGFKLKSKLEETGL